MSLEHTPSPTPTVTNDSSALEPVQSKLEPQKPQSSQALPQKKKPLPDWQPLGSVRDYFAEQLKHDQFQ